MKNAFAASDRRRDEDVVLRFYKPHILLPSPIRCPKLVEILDVAGSEAA